MDADDPIEDSGSGSDSDSSDDDDDSAMLMAELEKIKQEKAMEQQERVRKWNDHLLYQIELNELG